MSLLLAAPKEVQLSSIARFLEKGNHKASTTDLPSIKSVDHSNFNMIVLILPHADLAAIGSAITRMQPFFEAQAHIVLCVPMMTEEDILKIQKRGISTILTPSDWSENSIADRILGELTLNDPQGDQSFGAFKGASPAMKAVYSHLQKIAHLNEPVLIQGETGTGKEICAQEIHRLSKRNNLFPINCAALSTELFESELFGHKRGAFSGAVSDRTGLLSAIGDGTIFLDEIGELAQTSQAKLLRAIEQREIRPIGSNQLIPFKARLVLATNRDLREECLQGNFRSDLLERCQTFQVQLPPLRDRLSDIPLLVKHFIGLYNNEYNQDLTMPEKGLDALFQYTWPRNVRELRNAVWRAAAYAVSPEASISIEQLEESIARSHNREPQNPFSIPFDHTDTWQDVQAKSWSIYSGALLDAVDNNIDVAAKRAGLSRSTFYDKNKKFKTSE